MLGFKLKYKSYNGMLRQDRGLTFLEDVSG